MAEDQKKSGALAAWAGGAGVPARKAEIAKALAESVGAGGSGSGDVEYLSFSGQGSNFRGWTIGRDKVSPDPEAIYVIDPETATEGWTCWKGGGVAEKHEWSTFERSIHAIPAAQLVDHGPYADGDGWQFAMGIAMFDVDDPERMIKFSTTSKSGRNALSDLLMEIVRRIENDEPDIPVVKLASEKFQAQGKWNGKPKFAVEGWVTRPEVGRFLELGDDGDLEDLLSGNYAVQDGDVVDAEEEEPPKPARRKRRSAA